MFVSKYYLQEWWEKAIEPIATGLQNIFWGGSVIKSNDPAWLLRWGNLKHNRMIDLKRNLSTIQIEIYERDIPYEEHPSFC